MVDLKPWNILLIFGSTIALLGSTSSQMHMVSASPQGIGQCVDTPWTPCHLTNSNQSQGSSQGTAPDSSSSGTSSNANQGAPKECNPLDCQPAIDHINEAQSALRYGDTEGAQRHLDLAKKTLQEVCLSCLG